MIRVEIDGRPGGTYTIVERRDGEEVLHAGVYEEVERPRRLVFTLRVPQFSSNSSRIAIDFGGDGDGCLLTLDAGEENAEKAEKYRQGWATILHGLARQLGEDAEEEGQE